LRTVQLALTNKDMFGPALSANTYARGQRSVQTSQHSCAKGLHTCLRAKVSLLASQRHQIRKPLYLRMRACLVFGQTTCAGRARCRSALGRRFDGGKGHGQHRFCVAKPLIQLVQSLSAQASRPTPVWLYLAKNRPSLPPGQVAAAPSTVSTVEIVRISGLGLLPDAEEIGNGHAAPPARRQHAR
jgi:hypothetical protein